jgi:glutathione synthase/RimK-type ligase-like ATP-grasp enzyme
MACDAAILMLTSPEDATAKAVHQELERRGRPAVLFDPASFPLAARLAARSERGRWHVQFSGPDAEVSFDQVAAVWLRRPGLFRFHPDISTAERSFALKEAQMAVGGLFRTLNCLWVNHPERVITADYKPVQLEYASEIGFKVPRSLISNDPDSVMRFFEACGEQIIYKPLSGGSLPTADEADAPMRLYTSVVEREHLQQAGAIEATACLFQELVPKKTELRVTIIGNEVFPVQIDSQHAVESSIDWRRGYDHLRYRIYQLPREIRDGCLKLVRQFDLKFAAIDFVITPAGEYVFLEINPNGEWGWLEAETGLPMVEAMADLLSGANTVDRSL